MIGITILVIMSVALFLALQKTFIAILKFSNKERDTIKTIPISILWAVFFFLNNLFNAMLQNN
jgi:hypothetical protein